MSGRRNPMAAADLQAAVDAVAAMPVREHTKEGVWRQVGGLAVGVRWVRPEAVQAVRHCLL